MSNGLTLVLAFGSALVASNTIASAFEIDTLSRAFETGTRSVVEVTEQMLLRIDERDGELRAFVIVNPNALSMAKVRDRFHAEGVFHGPLDGIPIAVKDNIETSDPMPTTAGSLALANNLTRRDADVVARLRGLGAVIIGKTNLSEWANFRSRFSSSGWSAVGGQTRNPYDLTRSPCGSSSGSAVAVAAGMAAAAIGTETDGSIVCPAAVNGLVGFKPRVGELSSNGIVPISRSQDTAGPITQSVIDAVLLTEAMGGVKSGELVRTLRTSDAHGLLSGKRVGVVHDAFHPGVAHAFDDTLLRLESAGAKVIRDLAFGRPTGFGAARFNVLLYEFKHGLNTYFATLSAPLDTLDLGRLIEFNTANADRELVYFGQDIFEMAQAKGGLDSAEYLAALRLVQHATRDDGIDALVREHRLDVIVSPTTSPAWTIDHVNGDHYLGSAASYPAIAGYPHLTVPMAAVEHLPVGISIYGPPAARSAIFEVGRAVELLRSWQQSPTFALERNQ